nr:unnamed protein product [Callosobruchus analis]
MQRYVVPRRTRGPCPGTGDESLLKSPKTNIVLTVVQRTTTNRLLTPPDQAIITRIPLGRSPPPDRRRVPPLLLPPKG